MLSKFSSWRPRSKGTHHECEEFVRIDEQAPCGTAPNCRSARVCGREVAAVSAAIAPSQVGASGLVHLDPERRHFLVSRDAYRDPAVFEKEMRTVFGRCWLYVGHESEIPKPGDFVTRRIARREILFTRDRKGEARAFFNSCTHRGVA